MKQVLVYLSDVPAVQNRVDGLCRGEDRKSISSQHHSQPLDVVGVLMGDQYAGKLRRPGIQFIQRLFNPLGTDAAVHQKLGFL